MRLQGHKDKISPSHGLEVVGGLHAHDRFAAGLDQAEARLAHGLEMRAAGDQHHVGAGPRETGSEEATRRAGAEDRDSHRFVNCSATNRRWILPVGVFGIESTM